MGDAPDWSLVQQNTIFSGTIAAGQSAPNIDISEYQSVLIVVENSGISGVAALTASMFTDTPSVLVTNVLLSTEDTGGVAPFSLPVMGHFLTLFNDTAQGMQAQVVGITAQLPRAMVGEFNPSRSYAATIASGTASGTTSPLVSNESILRARNPFLSGYNGAIQIGFRIDVMGGATSWILQFSHILLDGTRSNQRVMTVTAPGDYYVTMGHPLAYVAWNVANTGGTLTAAVHPTLWMTPQSGG